MPLYLLCCVGLLALALREATTNQHRTRKRHCKTARMRRHKVENDGGFGLAAEAYGLYAGEGLVNLRSATK